MAQPSLIYFTADVCFDDVAAPHRFDHHHRRHMSGPGLYLDSGIIVRTSIICGLVEQSQTEMALHSVISLHPHHRSSLHSRVSDFVVMPCCLSDFNLSVPASLLA